MARKDTDTGRRQPTKPKAKNRPLYQDVAIETDDRIEDRAATLHRINNTRVSD